MKCNICDCSMVFFAHNRILNKYNINYFQCNNCGFVQTEEPFWLNEAYSSAILNSDVGMIERNMLFRKIVMGIISFCFKTRTSSQYLDYGGGYGVFVRMMRDLGFDFYWYDKYCEGIFVSAFMIADMNKKYDIATSFELFEHFSDPVCEVAEIFKHTDNIIFSTVLLPPSNPKPGEWWYYGLDGGQHISFYTKKSLQHLAKKFGKFYLGVNDIHIFSNFKIPYWKVYFCSKSYNIMKLFYRRKSLIPADYKKITGVDI